MVTARCRSERTEREGHQIAQRGKERSCPSHAHASDSPLFLPSSGQSRMRLTAPHMKLKGGKARTVSRTPRSGDFVSCLKSKSKQPSPPTSSECVGVCHGMTCVHAWAINFDRSPVDGLLNVTLSTKTVLDSFAPPRTPRGPVRQAQPGNISVHDWHMSRRKGTHCLQNKGWLGRAR